MKYLFDYTRMIDEFDVRGYTCSQVATLLGITERKLLRKLTGLEDFTLDEIRVLSDRIFEISPEKIPEYFFKERKK